MSTLLDTHIDTLENKYRDKLVVNKDLSRKLVSFQANKKIPGYGWYKFKEGFSQSLVEYVLEKLDICKTGNIIDPFAGSGTTLFAGSKYGMNAVGIELLPLGIEIIEVRELLLSEQSCELRKKMKTWFDNKPWTQKTDFGKLNYLKITDCAYPKETELLISSYLQAINNEKDADLKKILRFILLCVLEDISYTRKDGQYLRWDSRAGKSKSTFNKGIIKNFEHSIHEKFNEIFLDLGPSQKLDFDEKPTLLGNVELQQGSCLALLPKLDNSKFDILMTSPPYCNRYDYTRTYALELALLGASEDSIKNLRQTLLSCTVENKEKTNIEELFSTNTYKTAVASFEKNTVLQGILNYLDECRLTGDLNNPGIVRMVKNYFYELALLIFESAKKIKKDGYFVMVNDNVRYAGINIPVDLILSDFAQDAGFDVEVIWVLPTGKGNSSQQMGKHGRTELRKCVYVWRLL